MAGIRSLVLTFLLFFLVTCGYSQLNIVAISDSHGAQEIGWVNQLKKLRPNDSILNFSISGNTLGFDNLGRIELNELKNIDLQLQIASTTFQKIDFIIVMLGTNDCKAIFDSLQERVPRNLEKIIQTIKTKKSKATKIILVTPPPIAADEMMEPKYHGAANRLQKLLPAYVEVSKKYSCTLVDVYTSLSPKFDSLNTDGIHLAESGYVAVAKQINRAIK